MPRKTEFKINLGGLEDLRDKLGTNRYVKVGVLSSGKAGEIHPGGDEAKPLTYAQLAMIQMFGSHSRNIPARDFLRMPIELKKSELINLMKSERVKQMIEAGQIQSVFKWLGLMAEGIIQRAFASRGYGLWKENAPSTIAQKGSDMPLIDEGELRKAITSEVTSKSSKK